MKASRIRTPSGVRIGIDRDEDGFFDTQEGDEGTDAADPLDFPAGVARHSHGRADIVEQNIIGDIGGSADPFSTSTQPQNSDPFAADSSSSKPDSDPFSFDAAPAKSEGGDPFSTDLANTSSTSDPFQSEVTSKPDSDPFGSSNKDSGQLDLFGTDPFGEPAKSSPMEGQVADQASLEAQFDDLMVDFSETKTTTSVETEDGVTVTTTTTTTKTEMTNGVEHSGSEQVSGNQINVCVTFTCHAFVWFLY